MSFYLTSFGVVDAAEVKAPILDAKTRLELFGTHSTMRSESPYSEKKWKYIGPTNISGRCTDVEALTPRGQQYTIWVGAATGGVWKSVNEGTTFEPVFDEMPTASIGDIAIDPWNPDVVWVGTGEANIFRSSNAGIGVFRTTDGGDTWQHMGLESTHTIPRIRIHPENSEIVYVAAGGHEWTPNPERGLFKTTDGGETWKQTLYIDDHTGVNDLVLDPSNPEIIYCTTWQRQRLKWNDPRTYFNHKQNGVWKSIDGGETWHKINTGLPEPRYRGRIGIDIAASNPQVLYAYIDNYEIAREAKEGEKDAYGRAKQDVIKGATVFRTDNGGESWVQVSGLDEKTTKYMEGHSGTYGWVFAQIRVDPNDENRIYSMGLMLNVSEDGGKTFEVLRGMHMDHHGLWIDPNNSDYLLNVQDGGLAISYDRGKNWKTPLKVLPLAQFYNVAFDMADPFRVIGSIQDHGSYYGTVDLSRGWKRVWPVEFNGTLGGEGTTHAVDLRDGTLYASSFYGNLMRQNINGSERKRLLPPPLPNEERMRGQWLTPTIISTHNPDIVYHGMQSVLMSRDRGNTWETISPDLSSANPKKLGDINFQTITALSESPLRFGLLYAGTDDGRIWRTTSNGKEWTEIRSGAVPARWVSRLVASEHDLTTVYMTQTGRRDDDFQVYVWKSADLGETWTDISGNIPLGPVNVVREDPEEPDWLYVGTDAGVYVTKNCGEQWDVLGDLPFAYVHDLVYHPRDKVLIIATHGRGMWIFDAEQLEEKKEKELNATDLSEEEIDGLIGAWSAQGDANGMPLAFTLEFSHDGESFAGTMSFAMGEADMNDIRFDGKALLFKATFEMGEQSMDADAECEVEGDTLTGTVTSMMGKMDITGKKESLSELD
jgi:photosystem II stability/assembly factor-like uncharacterized protein